MTPVRGPFGDEASYERPTPERSASRRILIVEDNTDSGRVLTAMAMRMGHDVRYAVDGRIGLSYAKSFRPEVVLLDLGLPDMDGFEVCRRIKEHPELRQIQIIIVSGRGDDDSRARAKAAGADLHLLKPVDAETLERLLSP